MLDGQYAASHNGTCVMILTACKVYAVIDKLSFVVVDYGIINEVLILFS
jgi:hypothetical protein